MTYRLRVLEGRLAVCRLEADEPVPAWATGPVTSVTRTARELSVVCEEARVPAGVRFEGGWRALEVDGPLDFSLVGVVSSLTGVLAGAGVSVFVLSTFDTDYVLVREGDLGASIEALKVAGHAVQGAGQ